MNLASKTSVKLETRPEFSDSETRCTTLMVNKQELTFPHCHVIANAPLATRTTWRIGGPARWLVQPTSQTGLQHLWKNLPADLPILLLGGGSNLLINDDGFDGIVVDLVSYLDNIKIIDTPTHPDKSFFIIEADAGVSTRALAHFCRKQGIDGISFLAGIPGTLGGAVKMNAGAYGKEMVDVISELTLLDKSGNPHILIPSDLEMTYRSSQIPAGWMVASVRLKLPPGNPEAIRNQIRILNKKRSSSQPLGYPSAGSTFKNPDQGPLAWQLIDQAGYRGKKVGQAQVSEKHSNFLINLGGCSAHDMMLLIDQTRHAVAQSTGFHLKLEVGIVDKIGLRTEN
ncbi:MAG: UDP-N-acetylmuramate dehydrogenase [Magnetococcales bacterium]|nr:UDP-N-acetylmuramate dehydrogenase [Magnetococcales bacterium]